MFHKVVENKNDIISEIIVKYSDKKNLLYNNNNNIYMYNTFAIENNNRNSYCITIVIACFTR